ncbi:MAG TPA: hypothetical protein VMW14_01305 [Candidatus Paceibacterota bacterium]|nr:hypothetical protein [Candidatus Paceibacterota bacterium]
MKNKDVSGILLTLLALSMSLLVFNVAVKQAKAAPDPWEMPVIYLQSILLGPSTLRINVAVYNLTNTFYPTDDEWSPGQPLGPYAGGPVSRYNYSLGNLYAFDISISWNPAVLSYTSHVKTVPRSTSPVNTAPFRSKGILNSPTLPANDDVDPVAGTYRIGYTSNYPAASFNAPEDAANVFSMTFAVLGAGDNELSLDSVSLVVDNLRFPTAQPNVPYRVVLDPYLAHNVGVEAAPRNKDIIGQGKPFDTYALVKNAGDSSETFDVTIYATNATDDYVVGTASTTVPARSSQTVKVTCSSTGLAKGTYTVKAVVDTVTDETYTADNELIQGTILVTLAGDVDGNKCVNIFDIVKMAGVYGITSQSNPKYDPYCDLDNNYAINIFDIVTAAGNYGKCWT